MRLLIVLLQDNITNVIIEYRNMMHWKTDLWMKQINNKSTVTFDPILACWTLLN